MNKRKTEGNSQYEMPNSNNRDSSEQSCGYLQKEQEINRKQIEQITYKNKKHGPWTKNEEIKFISYVQTHIQIFQDKDLRRRKKIFRQMAKCIKSRSSQQCRSHHQKYQIRFSSHQNMIDQLKQKLKINSLHTYKQPKPQKIQQDPNVIIPNFEQPKPAERLFAYYPTQRLEDKRNLSSNLSSPNEIVLDRRQGYEILQKTLGPFQIRVVLDLQKFFA